MARTAAQPAANRTAVGDYWNLRDSFRRSLTALNRSRATIRIYLTSVEQFGRFLEERGMPLVVANITREHVEEFMAAVLKRNKPSSAETRYRGLQAFFKWAVDEGEIPTSPMARMKRPTVPETPPPMLSDDQIRRLLQVCEGRGFFARRDTAIVRLFVDTGMRRSELAYLRLEDIDLDNNVAAVVGKFRRPRACPFGRKTAVALDRYLRERAKHPHADSPFLWLGPRGALSDGAIDLIVRRRAREAGLTGVHAHLFRHGYAHTWLVNGGQEQDLMMLTGWRSRSMLGRYGASAAAERAREAYRRLSPGDRL